MAQAGGNAPARLCSCCVMCVPAGRESEKTGGAAEARDAGRKWEGGD
jgi:hypothetical protein